jgi:hypothetical protein
MSAPLIWRLEPDAVVYGIFDSLLRPQVALCGLYRYMAEEELDLFEFAASNMAEPSA